MAYSTRNVCQWAGVRNCRQQEAAACNVEVYTNVGRFEKVSPHPETSKPSALKSWPKKNLVFFIKRGMRKAAAAVIAACKGPVDAKNHLRHGVGGRDTSKLSGRREGYDLTLRGIARVLTSVVSRVRSCM